MTSRGKAKRAARLLGLLVLVVSFLPACGRKAKPQPLWSAAPAIRIQLSSR